MEVNVPNNKLRKILSNEKKMRKHYNEITDKLISRINLLQVVDNLSKIPVTRPERCHLLQGEYEGCYAVCIDAKWRIVIRPSCYDPPYNKTIITEIDILEITDYHD